MNAATVSEPTTREEIEAALRDKYQTGALSLGLFDTGLAWVVVSIADGELHFQWFDEKVSLDQVFTRS